LKEVIMAGIQTQTIASAEPVLSVRNLTTSFLVDGAWKPVVRDVSFDVAPGETVAIVGESGSGKSVTSLSIMRLLQADSSRIEGKIMLGGRDLLALPETQMRKVRGNDVAMIFQEPMTSSIRSLRSATRFPRRCFATDPCPMPKPAPRPSACSKRSVFPRLRRGLTNIRTDSPAACANA
jgi:ABC-type multidrug transport system fused ATPase/permease subunit